MTTLMDNVERPRARVCVRFFRGTDIHTRVLKLACMRQQAEAGVRSKRVQANGTKVDCDYTCVSVLTRARTRVRT